MRLFAPTAYSDTLELGSLVVSESMRGMGVSEALISLAEQEASAVNRILLSITDQDALMQKYQDRGWQCGDDLYPIRAAESPGKSLWTKS